MSLLIFLVIDRGHLKMIKYDICGGLTFKWGSKAKMKPHAVEWQITKNYLYLTQ